MDTITEIQMDLAQVGATLRTMVVKHPESADLLAVATAAYKRSMERLEHLRNGGEFMDTLEKVASEGKI